MNNDYIVVLKIRDNISGRAKADLKRKIAKAVNDAFKDLDGWSPQAPDLDDVSLFDIQVAEVV